ncbi:unnamed protein product [Dracunculus medinensis]|uniref:G_PROTEIN_RECEP_F1_2 domain-containing protein n=1 Tax=Dracunculus medinensis TaxID=318479 RepID=A0A0N4URQ6_DRAME|nr:unnamed protein product [Dracunculus medinensis]
MSSRENLANETFSSEICGDFEKYTLARFVFLTIASSIALLGTLGNLLLIYIFSMRKYPNTPPTLYPTVLAVLDALICFLYILLFGADAAVVFLHVRSLFILYHIYIVPAYVVSRITQLAIPYMLIFATLERLVWISGKLKNLILKRMYSMKGRQLTVIISLTSCAILRLPTVFAVVVHHFPNCSDFFRSESTGPADWVLESSAYHFFDFHLLSIAQTFIPFFVLVIFNAPSISASNVSLAASLKKKAVRNAIYTMLAIATSYLMSNTLHLILTILERSKTSILRDPVDPNLASSFHTAFSDTVSFVYMFTSAIRIVIYYVCNPAVREDLQQMLHRSSKTNRSVDNL